jgi:hypothetical protein
MQSHAATLHGVVGIGHDSTRATYRIRTLMCREKIHLFDMPPELGFA